VTDQRVTDQPEKLDLKSMDLAAEKQAELLRLFPEIRTEGGKIDFDRLKLALGETVDVGRERYGLTWPGKADCFKTIQAPSLGTLRPAPDESVNFDTTENLIIEGDNLEVLKLLQKSYLGKIKMIYIDPPYNTGNDFIYPDQFGENLQTYLEYTGQVDSQGRKFGTNSETDGRFHSKWLNMVYPRLYLARNLLRDDGVICVSIDDNELTSLRLVLNDIFGEENFEGHLHWRRRHNQPNDPTKMIGLVAEHIIVYAKNSAFLKKVGVGKIAITGTFTNSDNDPRGDWASKPWKVGSDQSGSRYKIITSAGIELDEEWMGEEETYKQLLADKRIIFPDKGKGAPRKKYFKSERIKEGQSATNWWPHELHGHNQGANAAMEALFGEKNVFSNPKPTELIGNLMAVGNVKEADIVLDFFAGSGVTAESTFRVNGEDDGNRKFILVQLPEPTDRADFPTIADITKERVRRVISKLNDDDSSTLDFKGSTKQDRGFRVFKLAESNFTGWDAGASKDAAALSKQLEFNIHHVRQGRSDEDLFYELLLKSGFPLTIPVEKLSLAGKAVYSIGGGVFLICLERELTTEAIKAMADMKPSRVVCLDDGFRGNDQLKSNAVLTFKAKGVAKFQTV
jgi:adenine-specific DNA-methyltransferase